MKRFLFNIVYGIYKKMGIATTPDANPVVARQNEILTKLKAMKWFSHSYVIFGDSNSENLNSNANLNYFDSKLGFGVNIGIGGSRADSWLDFFALSKGREVQEFIASTKYIILNIGGNHILQGKMDEVVPNLQTLHTLFPKSINCLVPPIWYDYLSGGNSQVAEDIKSQVLSLNQIIKNIWGERFVDTYTPFVGLEERKQLFWILQDAVHFSENADMKIRIPLIIEKIKSLQF